VSVEVLLFSVISPPFALEFPLKSSPQAGRTPPTVSRVAWFHLATTKPFLLSPSQHLLSLYFPLQYPPNVFNKTLTHPAIAVFSLRSFPHFLISHLPGPSGSLLFLSLPQPRKILSTLGTRVPVSVLDIHTTHLCLRIIRFSRVSFPSPFPDVPSKSAACSFSA